MRRLTQFASVFVVLMLTANCASAPAVVELVPEERATIRVGETRALAVAEGYYSIGSAGTSLVQSERLHRAGREVRLYRAVAPGEMTFVLTPNGTPDGQCISCVTEHYFVTVVP
jgi:hypothetical protein